MRKVLAIFCAAVLFLDIIISGVLFFTSGGSQSETDDESIFTRATVFAVGSNLMQEEMLVQAKDRSNTGGYDFSFVYENIRALAEEADVSLITQSSVISSGHAVSGSGRYNSPPELGDELVKDGFNVINLATDHILDYGEEGLLNTLDYWGTKEGVVTTGVFRNYEEAADLTMLEANGIKFGFVSFTDSTGGKSLPENSQAVITTAAAETVLSEKISYAKRKTDVVIVCANWGSEFEQSLEENDDRRRLAAEMADWGADVIIGGRSESVLDAEYFDTSDGRRVLAVYSLGRITSCATEPRALLGGMLTFDVVKNKEERTVSVENFGIAGAVTHYGVNMSKIRVYPLSEYTNELAQVHGIRETDSDFGVRYLNNILNETYDRKLLK